MKKPFVSSLIIRSVTGNGLLGKYINLAVFVAFRGILIGSAGLPEQSMWIGGMTSSEHI